MKSNVYKLLVLFFTTIMAITSCVKKDDFSVPETEVEAPNIDAADVIEISSLFTIKLLS